MVGVLAIRRELGPAKGVKGIEMDIGDVEECRAIAIGKGWKRREKARPPW